MMCGIEEIKPGEPALFVIFVEQIPPIIKCIISRNGRFALCSTGEGLYLMRLLEGSIQKLSVELQLPEAISFHPSEAIALAFSSRSVSLINVLDPEDTHVKTIPWTGADLKRVAFSADGNNILLYAQSELFLMKFNAIDCSVGTRKLLFRVSSELRFTHDGRFAYIISPSTYIFDLTSLDNEDLIIPIELWGKRQTCLAVSNDSNFAIVGHNDGSVKLWSLLPVELKGSLVKHDSAITSLSLSNDDSRIVWNSAKNGISLLMLPRIVALAQLVEEARKLPLMPRCAQCKINQLKLSKPLLTCSRCQIAKYCSADCQRKDWPSHKKVCRKVNKSCKGSF